MEIFVGFYMRPRLSTYWLFGLLKRLILALFDEWGLSLKGARRLFLCCTHGQKWPFTSNFMMVYFELSPWKRSGFEVWWSFSMNFTSKLWLAALKKTWQKNAPRGKIWDSCQFGLSLLHCPDIFSSSGFRVLQLGQIQVSALAWIADCFGKSVYFSRSLILLLRYW